MKQKKEKTMIFITNRGACRLIWFVLGQAIQLVFHALYQNWWDVYQIPLCVASGIVVLFFLFAGMWVTAKEREATTARREDMQ